MSHILPLLKVINEFASHFLHSSQALLSAPLQDPTVLSCVLVILFGSEQAELGDVHNITQSSHDLQ